MRGGRKIIGWSLYGPHYKLYGSYIYIYITVDKTLWRRKKNNIYILKKKTPLFIVIAYETQAMVYIRD